jgi:DNA repair protein RecN (Recombination protein N)
VASRGDKTLPCFQGRLGDATITRIKLLSPEERVYELARLLSGSSVSGSALENARDTVQAAGN